MNTPHLPKPRTAERHIRAPKGELDLATVGQLQTLLAGVGSLGATHVVLDLSPVTFMDATALGVIVAAANRLRRAGGRLSLVGAAPSVTRLLHLTGLHQVLLPIAAE